MSEELKIKTPYGVKNWSYLKKVMDEDTDRRNGILPPVDRQTQLEDMAEDRFWCKNEMNLEEWLTPEELAEHNKLTEGG